VSSLLNPTTAGRVTPAGSFIRSPAEPPRDQLSSQPADFTAQSTLLAQRARTIAVFAVAKRVA
jgi:hypothetical protein